MTVERRRDSDKLESSTRRRSTIQIARIFNVRARSAVRFLLANSELPRELARYVSRLGGGFTLAERGQLGVYAGETRKGDDIIACPAVEIRQTRIKWSTLYPSQLALRPSRETRKVST